MFNQNNVKTIQIPRSYKKLRPTITTTFNTGEFIPFFNMEIIPNDKISLGIAAVTNMQTPNFATMDTLKQDIAFFYCPNRLVYDNWDKFYGEGKNADYEEYVELFIPQLKCPTGGWEEGTIADYLGLPTKKKCHDVSALPFRMLAMIYNEYYRDEQRMAKAIVSKGDADQTGSNGSDYINDLQNGGKVPKTCRLFDYFTGSKLEFQAGDPVLIPVGESAPVKGNGKAINIYTDKNNPEQIAPIMLAKQNSNAVSPGTEAEFYPGDPSDFQNIRQFLTIYGTSRTPNPEQTAGATYRSVNSNQFTGTGSGSTQSIGLTKNPEYSGMVADLSLAKGISVRDFKKLLMLQQSLQNIEDGGSRYIEQLYKRWGIRANELELEIPKFLGSTSTILNMAMVAGTAQENFGNFTGLSNTFTKSHIFTYHFKQHGYLFGIVTIRPQNTYENGIHKSLVKKTIDDFYTPEMAYFGPDIVKNYEIYSDASDGKDDDMFGVRNYGDELRYIPNKVTGQMRTNSQFSQAFKTYSINYATRPLNNEEFILSSKNQVDKTLKDNENLQINQFTFQAQIEIDIVRNIPKNPNAEMLIRF